MPAIADVNRAFYQFQSTMAAAKMHTLAIREPEHWKTERDKALELLKYNLDRVGLDTSQIDWTVED